MHSDKEIIELIKTTYPLKPNVEFVVRTEEKLIQKAIGINRSKMIQRTSKVYGGLVLCIIAMSLVFFLSGNETAITSLNSSEKVSTPLILKDQKSLVFIYNSHNLEAFKPELSINELSEAHHDKKNISLVGERLSKELKERNISAIHDKRNISGILKERGLSPDESYMITRESLDDALKNNKSIKMAFDIHRDSLERTNTTVNINGKEYSRILFVVSDSHDSYMENLDFAEIMHQKIEEKYPGLSRGVILISTNNTYNQDILKESVLLNIGGVENTLEEEYRTVEVFADVIKEIIEMKK